MPSSKKVKLILTNALTNESYVVKLSAEDSAKAQSDMEFAGTLLQMVENDRLEQREGQASSSHPDALALINPQNSVSDDDDEAVDDPSGQFETDEAGDTSQKDGSYKWTIDACLFFLATYQLMERSFSTGKSSVKTCWQKVADIMSAKGYSVTWEKCATKMNSLKRTYKSVTDHNKKSGASRRTWVFYDKCDEIFGNKPWCKPLTTASSVASTDQEDDLSIASASPAKKSRKKNNMVEEYLNKALQQKEQSRVTRERQHEATLQRIDTMNNLLARLIQKPGSAAG